MSEIHTLRFATATGQTMLARHGLGFQGSFHPRSSWFAGLAKAVPGAAALAVSARGRVPSKRYRVSARGVIECPTMRSREQKREKQHADCRN